MSLRFKRHYKLIVMLLLVSAVLGIGLGNERIEPMTIPAAQAAATLGDGSSDLARVTGTIVDGVERLMSVAGP